MTEQAVLKIFGTGQITIPKDWRDWFGADSVKAVFNKEDKKISLQPVRMVEMEDTKWISTKQLSKELADSGMSDQLQAEILNGYQQSDFYQAKLKNKTKKK